MADTTTILNSSSTDQGDDERDRARRNAHAAYYRRKDSGDCVNCGKRPKSISLRCELCAIRARAYSLERSRFLRTDYRDRIHKHYGGKCACCGETEPLFLEIDHIQNDGKAHRDQIGSGRLYEWIVKNDFPDNLQLLCSNCNQGKQRNGGVCPHVAQTKEPPVFVVDRPGARVRADREGVIRA